MCGIVPLNRIMADEIKEKYQLSASSGVHPDQSRFDERIPIPNNSITLHGIACKFRHLRYSTLRPLAQMKGFLEFHFIRNELIFQYLF